ncbi:MAG: ATP-binding protein [Peptostreptococcaceae bacterium]
MAKIKKKAIVDKDYCVACGSCVKVCPLGIIKIEQGVYAKINEEKCVGCSKCAKVCPASVIEIKKIEVGE